MVDKHKLVEVLSKALPNWSFNEQSFIGPGIRRRVPTDALVEIVNGLEASKQEAQSEKCPGHSDGVHRNDWDGSCMGAGCDYRFSSPASKQEAQKPPGMAVQALAGEIVAALLADEQDGGYDLEAGLFGPNFSTLVRRWASAEWNDKQEAQGGQVPECIGYQLSDGDGSNGLWHRTLNTKFAADEHIRVGGKVREVYVLAATPKPQAEPAPGRVMVPKKLTQAMRDVMDSDGWTWEDLLAAAEAITEAEYEEIAAQPEAVVQGGQVPHIWGYAVRNPKEPGWPVEVVRTRDHADRVAIRLYEAEIIPLVSALAATPKPQAEPWHGIDAQKLLRETLKPEEIAGDSVTQHKRVDELLHWFSRYIDKQANPKWFHQHAFELAYYIATDATSRAVDLKSATDAAYIEGFNVPANVRAMLHRLDPVKFHSATQPEAVVQGGQWPNVESAMADPLFQQARAIMGTENWFQDNALRNVINYVLAASPPAPQPERVVLTPGQLAAATEGIDFTPSDRRAFIEGVRFAERFHGIGTSAGGRGRHDAQRF